MLSRLSLLGASGDPFRSGASLCCSDACAKWHPSVEPCHASVAVSAMAELAL